MGHLDEGHTLLKCGESHQPRARFIFAEMFTQSNWKLICANIARISLNFLCLKRESVN
jgi:hypothetical protein